jgi:uncharacterized protein YndB with AHSA1/START domain
MPVRVGPRRLGGQVPFPVPVDVAFAYLADPRNRPEWQSSLAGVEMLTDGAPRVGTRWRDHTKVRVVPEMEITELEPNGLWAESGTWRAIRAELTLRFEPTATGCLVDVGFRVAGRGVLRVVGWPITVAGVLPVLADVRHAARILGERQVA